MQGLRRWSLGLAVACLLLTVPGLGEAQSSAAAQAKDAAKKSGKVAPGSPVDLNTASAAELQAVPGIGAPTAKKIVAGRPYSSVADLSKAGLSAKQISAFSSMVKVGSAPPAPAPAPAVKPMTPSTPVAKTPAPPRDASNTAAGTAVPGGGPGMVWVNTETKVFHRQGDKFYGATKRGKYMAEAAAVAAGYHESKQKTK